MDNGLVDIVTLPIKHGDFPSGYINVSVMVISRSIVALSIVFYRLPEAIAGMIFHDPR